MADIFEDWNEGELQSDLILITARVLRQRDPDTGQRVVDLILDKAGQNGTGQWTLISAAENAAVASTINAAVEARVLSSMKAARVAASTRLQGPTPMLVPHHAELARLLQDALYAAKVVSYTQGLDLMRTMSEKKIWALDLGSFASIWRGGCIIRARFLDRITEAYRADPGLPNLMLAPFFEGVLNRSLQAWRDVVAMAVAGGVPVPALSASLASYAATAALGCPPTCCRRNATSSAPTPTNASTGRPVSGSTP